VKELDANLDAKKKLEKVLVLGSENGKKDLKKNLNGKNLKKNVKKTSDNKNIKNTESTENNENHKHVISNGIDECYESKEGVIDDINPEILKNEKNKLKNEGKMKNEKEIDDMVNNVLHLFQIEVIREKNVLTLRGVNFSHLFTYLYVYM
jgi:hypothetical protein